MEEAKSAMEVVRPILLVTDVNSTYWHSNFQADTISSIRWHVLMDHPVELDITANGVPSSPMLTTEMLKKSCMKSKSLNYTRGPDGVAIICFTSGTTGRPKGVTLSHSAFTVQSLAKIAAVGYGISAYCSIVPHWWIIISHGHANGRWLSCFDAQV